MTSYALPVSCVQNKILKKQVRKSRSNAVQIYYHHCGCFIVVVYYNINLTFWHFFVVAIVRAIDELEMK